jgi:excisionase family DNA binding protein
MHKLLLNQTSPHAIATGDNTAPVADSAKRTANESSPPLPSGIALAYRVNDAAKVSGLSRSTIYNLIAEKKLRSTMVAGRRLIPADALRQLLQGAA